VAQKHNGLAGCRIVLTDGRGAVPARVRQSIVKIAIAAGSLHQVDDSGFVVGD